MDISIPSSEYTLTTTRSSGPGGQHVNKVSTAIELKFSVHDSSLPDDVKERLLKKRDKRITSGGIILIVARRSRSQLKNRQDAIRRLHAMVQSVALPPKPRKATKPGKSAKAARRKAKEMRSILKAQRRKVSADGE